MKFKLMDTVRSKRTGKIGQVVRVSSYETHEFKNGEEVYKIEVFYKLDDDIHTYVEEQLEIVCLSPESEFLVDDIIIDMNLKEKNFDFLKQYLGGNDND